MGEEKKYYLINDKLKTYVDTNYNFYIHHMQNNTSTRNKNTTTYIQH